MDIDAAVRAEQARYLHNNLVLSVLASLVAAGFAVWVVWFEAPSPALWAWLGATFMLAGWRLERHRAWRSRYADEPAGWFRAVGLGAGLAGSLWGLAAVYLIVTASLPLQFAILYGGVLLTVAALFSYGAHYPTFLAYFLPLMLPALAALLAQRSVFAGGIAAAVGIFTTVAIMIGRRFNRSFLDSLRLRFENLGLVAELTLQKEAAEAANVAKSRFLAAASHDLRQPMHALNLYHGALASAALPDSARQLLDNARQCTQAMDDMFVALLDMSRLDAGAITPLQRPFAVQTLLERVAVEFELPALEKGISLRIRASKSWALGDAALVGRIVRNFVANAVRYTEQGGILVVCRRRGECWRIEVWDSGPGIAPDMHAAVFEEFLQLGNAERDRSKGLGLGLAIVARLARLMSTPVTLRSRPGRGSVFAVELPAAPVGASGGRSPAVALLDGTPALTGLRVLVIDDEALIRDAVAQMLTARGCEVIEANAGAQAVQRLADVPPPDALVCDHRLRDGETGLDAIARVRAHCGVNMPALLVTGDTAPQRLLELGASGLPVLHKPVQSEVLCAALESLLRRAGTRLPLRQG